MDNSTKRQQNDKAPTSDVERDGFSAEDLGQESAYNDATEIAQMMRRGNESVHDPNDRDVVGASDAATDTENQPFPEHQRTKNDLIENEPEQSEDRTGSANYPYFSKGDKIRGEK